MGRVAGMSLWEAILEINYWCAEHATYEATDSRTASPMTMYRSGKDAAARSQRLQLRRIGVSVLRRGRSIHQDGRTVMTIMRGLRCLWTASGIFSVPVSRKKCWIPAGSRSGESGNLIHTRNFSDYVKESNEEYLEKKERCTTLTIQIFMAERSW